MIQALRLSQPEDFESNTESNKAEYEHNIETLLSVTDLD